MKRLYLLRHAKSSWDQPNLEDHDRPLAPRGTRAGRAMAAVVAALDPPPALVLCSTAVRARQTLDLVRPDGAAGGPPVSVEESLYTFDPLPLRLRLGQVADSVPAVLVIGHNPALERLAGDLCRRDGGKPARRLRQKFPTAALAALDVPVDHWADIAAAAAPASARVVAFTRPADLPDVDTGPDTGP
jgi:phosphohistidine phosphatase